MMLLLKCRKGQSLEKVEKLCRTANADKKFPTHINNSHHTFATRKTALQFRCTCACLARSREKKSRESDSERTRDSGFVASTGVRQRLQFKPSPEVPASAGRRATARLQQRGRSSFESRSARASSDKRLCRWRAGMTGRRMCRSEQCIRRSEQCWPPITRYKLFARPDWQMLRDASGPAQAFVKIGPFSPKFLAAQRVAA
jgi:hypothetical protein